MIAVLHVRERHVGERFHRLEWIAWLLWRRSTKRAQEIGGRALLDRRSLRAVLEVVKDAVHGPMREHAHLVDVETQGVALAHRRRA